MFKKIDSGLVGRRVCVMDSKKFIQVYEEGGFGFEYNPIMLHENIFIKNIFGRKLLNLLE